MVQIQAMQITAELCGCSLAGIDSTFCLHRLEVQQHYMPISIAYKAVKHACNIVVGYHDAKLNSHRLSALQEPTAAKCIHPCLVLAFNRFQAEQQCFASRVDMIATWFPNVPRVIKALPHLWRSWLSDPTNAIPYPFALVSVSVNVLEKLQAGNRIQHGLHHLCNHDTIPWHTFAHLCQELLLTSAQKHMPGLIPNAVTGNRVQQFFVN